MIGDFVKKVERFEPVQESGIYRLLGMRSKIGGPFVRETKSGSEISAKKLNKVQAGDFIYSRLFAWQGSFGLVPDEMDGCYVSNEFPLYEVDSAKVIPSYLVYWFGLPQTQKIVEADCSGSTPGTRNRFKEAFFEKLAIEVPSLAEQKAIVQRIKLIESKKAAALDVRQSILDDAQAMLASTFHKIIEGVEYKTMEEVAPIVKREVEVNVNDDYPELGVRSFGKGVFHKPTLKGVDLPDWQKFYQIEKDDLIFNVRKSWEGSIGVASDEDHGRVASHNSYLTCVPVEGVVTSQFLCFYFLSKDGLMQIDSGSRGSADRNRVISMGRLNKFTVPVPDYDKQLWFNQLQSYVAKIKQAQSENEIELEALMPSVLDKAFKGELV